LTCAGLKEPYRYHGRTNLAIPTSMLQGTEKGAPPLSSPFKDWPGIMAIPELVGMPYFDKLYTPNRAWILVFLLKTMDL